MLPKLNAKTRAMRTRYWDIGASGPNGVKCFHVLLLMKGEVPDFDSLVLNPDVNEDLDFNVRDVLPTHAIKSNIVGYMLCEVYPARGDDGSYLKFDTSSFRRLTAIDDTEPTWAVCVASHQGIEFSAFDSADEAGKLSLVDSMLGQRMFGALFCTVGDMDSNAELQYPKGGWVKGNTLQVDTINFKY